MVQARIHRGRIKLENPIPKEWEGQLVKIVPLTPDDEVPDLEKVLAALEAMGPMEYEPGEQRFIEEMLEQMDRFSLDVMRHQRGTQS